MQEKSEQRKCQERSDCQKSDGERCVCVRVIEEEEEDDDPIEYFLPVGVESTS